MIAVIFEVVPRAGRVEDYFRLAGELKAELSLIDGFVSIERFESVSTPGKFVSLSFWRDEAAVKQWRNLESHRRAQAVGRGEVFEDYRLRVAEVVRDYGMKEREGAPGDSKGVHGG